jgi:chromosome segregation protein
MYLKNLTMLGFKSFADKTSLNFQPGVSAIVGPNGCGKSNVSDAIRWVLGEQSAKALRGGEMADVIFNGTDGRKPLGMAEVSLTIGGVDEEQLKAAGVEVSYNEVTLTRRVFRDGGSEYFINKTACRLKDIQQLFMGTGVGRTSYSIMAQGNITQILSSKPDDRRLVFEEAAGITKFKAQKKESLRKLEYTDQNLLRVADLIREVKRQIGSLQRQAGKARRFKEFQTRLQLLETQFARHQFDVLQEEIAQRQATLEKLLVEIEVCGESVNRGEGEISQLRERLTEHEEQVNASQQQGLELKGQIERHESRIHFNQERLRELEQQNSRALADIAQAEERRLVSEQELVVVNEKLALSTEQVQQQRAVVEEKRQHVEQLEAELREKQDQLRRTQTEAFSAAQQLTRLRNDINSLEVQLQGNIVRLEKLSAEKIQMEEERVRLEARLQEFSATVEAEKIQIQSSRGTVEERQQRLKQLQHEISACSQQLDTLLRQQAEKRSRLNVLEQLQESHEGFSSGALSALKSAAGVLGSLSDKIQVPDQFVVAVEAALGQQLQLVLTEQPEAAQLILQDLSTNKKGRASIAALNLASSENGYATHLENLEQLQATPALNVVQAEPAVESLIKALLGRTLVVADLQTATNGWRTLQGRYDFVTHSGELLNRHGIFTGGSNNGSGKAPASILGRKNQILELQHQIEELQQQSQELSRQKGSLTSEQTELQASLQEAQTELRSQEVAIASREGEFRALQNSLRVLQQKQQTIEFELDNLGAQESKGHERRNALSAQVGEFEERERSHQVQLAELSAGLDSVRGQKEQANALLSEAKVALATEEQLASSFRNQQRPLEQRIRELAHLADQRRNELGAFTSRKEQADCEIADSQLKIEGLSHEREQVSLRTAELVAQREVLQVEIMEREENLRGQRRRLQELQQHRGTLDVELAQKNMSVQNLREKIQQKYQLNLEDIRSECITITIADEGPPKIETLTPEEMAASGAATDWSSVAEQIAALQKRIDEMGPVNLVAIEEYEETEQRYQFLTNQHDDLVKAKEQLLEVINRINSQTKEMFTETFNKIRDNFRAMFTEIFGGGKADLILVNEGDVLESGIDIVARPPGKQLQSISLLSGGEQTMTAVSLLFSIYQVKPSPFCVLDELDAPLDESNINRFIRVLQRFLSHSQFVIITHNKRTIGMADVLYGVTMQEHGVSRIVSVKFHKVDEQVGGPEPSRPLVPPPAPVQTNGTHPEHTNGAHTNGVHTNGTHTNGVHTNGAAVAEGDDAGKDSETEVEVSAAALN